MIMEGIQLHIHTWYGNFPDFCLYLKWRYTDMSDITPTKAEQLLGTWNQLSPSTGTALSYRRYLIKNNSQQTYTCTAMRNGA